MAKAAKDPEYLSTLERGLSVLRSFNHDRPEMQLSEVAVVTKLSPAVVRRCLKTLVQLGYVGQNGRKFVLRPEVLEFSSAYLSSMNVEQMVLPHLQALRDETGDSASMAVRSGNDILYVAHVSTNRHIRLGVSVGTRFPWYATSLGKVIVAFQSQPLTGDLLARAPFEPLTERTVTDADAMTERLQHVRERGFDSALDELDYGIVSVSVPIFDIDGTALAAINCSTSTTRMAQSDLINTRVPLLQDAAKKIQASVRRWPALAKSLAPG
jgi:IclR family pca regulon transcriptional regulator